MSEAEPPTKKQKKDKKHKVVNNSEGEAADVEKKENSKGKGGSEEGREHMGKDAAVMSIVSTLENLNQKFDNVDGRLEKFDSRLTSYDTNSGEFSQQLANTIGDTIKATVEEHLRVLGVGKSTQNVDNLSKVNNQSLPQKSINSPTLAKTPVKDQCEKNFAEDIAKDNMRNVLGQN